MKYDTYTCASCKGTGILGGRTTEDVWEPCPEEHELIEAEDE